ncbi:ThiF family adenylyltransferase [Lactobacillus taiwanensis]|uniref:ThiF family adenylyltransferase n=2 Tax=Lactobacillus taiwanensis TaxID=508451 RepID=UPI0015C5FF4F|nr:ThiF family adenylyltransferase [Lactobacillus taiwanensis]
MYKIADYVEVKEESNHFQLSYRKIWKIKKSAEIQKVIYKICTEGMEDEELKRTSIFKFLIKNKLIHKVSTNNIINPKTEYYFQNICSNADQVIKELMNKKICIVGLGGVGTQILQHLCGMNIKNYLLIDYDNVEKTNLNRQFIYGYEDIGRSKVDICERYIKNHVIDFKKIIKIKEKIQNPNQLINNIYKFDPAIIICAADQPQGKIQSIINIVGKKMNIPVISGGVGPDFASYGFSEKNSMKTLKEKNVIHKRQVTFGSFGPTNSFLSAMMAHDIIMKLCNKSCWAPNHRTIAIDFKTLNIHIL